MGFTRSTRRLLIALAVLLLPVRVDAAYALVGTIGTAVEATASTGVSPAWGSGESRTAGNLLICWLGCNGADNRPTAPSGWSVSVSAANGLNNSIVVYYKIATGGEAAPTFSGGSGKFHAQLAEFSGNDSSPLDQTGSASSATSPVTATQAAADAATGELLIIISVDLRSASRSPNDILTSNNATITQAGNNNGTLTVQHYSFGYGTTTSKSSATTAVMTPSATQSITSLLVGSATFKAPFVPPTHGSDFMFFFKP